MPMDGRFRGDRRRRGNESPTVIMRLPRIGRAREGPEANSGGICLRAHQRGAEKDFDMDSASKSSGSAETTNWPKSTLTLASTISLCGPQTNFQNHVQDFRTGLRPRWARGVSVETGKGGTTKNPNLTKTREVGMNPLVTCRYQSRPGRTRTRRAGRG